MSHGLSECQAAPFSSVCADSSKRDLSVRIWTGAEAATHESGRKALTEAQVCLLKERKDRKKSSELLQSLCVSDTG